MGKLDGNNRKYSGFLNSHQLSNWVYDYNAAKVDDSYPPLKASIIEMQNSEVQISSDLARAIDSCEVLGVQNHQIDSMFTEAGLPVPKRSFLPLPLNIWLICLRLMWLLGYSSNAESFKDANIRSVNAAKTLEDLANEHGSIALVGHGIMNRLIAKQLLATGWQKINAVQATQYWGFTEFEKIMGN